MVNIRNTFIYKLLFVKIVQPIEKQSLYTVNKLNEFLERHY